MPVVQIRAHRAELARVHELHAVFELPVARTRRAQRPNQRQRLAQAPVHAKPCLDRDRDGYGVPHGRDAVADQRGFQHQAGAKTPFLHPVGRAADVQVDLVVTGRLGHLRAGRQVGRITPSQLQGQRMFFPVEGEVPFTVAVDQRTGRNHLGVQHRVWRKQAVKIAAVPVGPVQHRRHA